MKLRFFTILLVLIIAPQLYAVDCVGECTPKFQIEGIEVSSLGNYQQLVNEVEVINDTRDIFSANSPDFMETFGKITIITKDGMMSHCTGNLVVLEPNYGVEYPEETSFVTTSQHCIGKRGELDYNSSYIVFTKRDGSRYKRKLSLVDASADSDWAILKIDRAISATVIKPLVVGPEYELVMDDSEMNDVETTVTAGGYSSDIFKGNRGENLTYDQQCEVVKSWGHHMTETDCIAYPGASGGALVVTGSDQDGEEIHNYLVGVNQFIADQDPERLVITPVTEINRALIAAYDSAGIEY